MPLAGLLSHRLAVVTPTFEVVNGETTPTGQSVDPVDGLVQPRSAAEVAALSQAGAEVSTHVVFLELRELAAGAWISDNPADVAAGHRYDVTGVRRFEFGSAPHLEVDARLVKP